MALSFTQSGPASYHLAVKAAHLCWTQHDHTVNGRTVPAFRQQHGIAQDVVFPFIKGFQDFCTVFALTIDFRSLKSLFIQDLFELLAGLYQWKEHDRLSVPAVFHHLVRDLVQIRIQGCCNVTGFKITGLDGYPGQIQLQRDCHGLDRG